MTTKDNYIATIKVHKLQDVYQKYWDKYGKPKFPTSQHPGLLGPEQVGTEKRGEGRTLFS